MHIEARTFLEKVRLLFPEYFINKRVIDIGAGDINGNNKYMFKNCEYVGVDVVPAPNVDIVSYAKDLPLSLGEFDVVVSSECFEHDMQIFQTLQRILKLIKQNGLFFFTCANIGRHEHGTKRTSPDCSYSTNLKTDDWYPNYYQNLSIDDICKMITLQNYFKIVHFEHNTSPDDLYFYGIRNNNKNYDSFNSQLNNQNQLHKSLSQFNYKNINILELGIDFSGSPYGNDSLNKWRQTFPNAVKIVGVCYNNSSKKYESKDMAVFIEKCNKDNNEIKQLISKYGNFDLIIDNDNSTCNLFEQLFPFLNNGGIYIIKNTDYDIIKNVIDKLMDLNDEYKINKIEHINKSHVLIHKQ